jgi:hypothetical protein
MHGGTRAVCKDLSKGGRCDCRSSRLPFHWNVLLFDGTWLLLQHAQWIDICSTSIDVMYGIRGRLDARAARVTMAVGGIPNAAGINVNVMSTAMVMHSLLARYLRIHHNESNKR